MLDRTTSLCSGMAYSAMVAEVRSLLGAGDLKMGDRVAGEVSLAKQYGISVTSVRRGIKLLVAEGLLERRRGSGTYVCGQVSQVHERPSRRDTVALIWPMAFKSYHPFYTEMFSGLRTTLGQLGWAVWEPSLQEPDTSEDIYATQVSMDHIQAVVADHPELAGLITKEQLVPRALAKEGSSLPVITPDHNTSLPSVAYCWDDELERGFRELLQRGRRHIWALTMFEEDAVRGAAQRAAAALGIPGSKLEIESVPNTVRSLSRTVQSAYTLAQQDFIGSAGAYIDGIIVGDDFLAQGVLDALQETSRTIPRDLDMVAIVNRTSRVQTPWPLITLVSDGHACGRALGELMHQHIVAPARAPRHVTLCCQLHSYD